MSAWEVNACQDVNTPSPSKTKYRSCTPPMLTLRRFSFTTSESRALTTGLPSVLSKYTRISSSLSVSPLMRSRDAPAPKSTPV